MMFFRKIGDLFQTHKNFDNIAQIQRAQIQLADLIRLLKLKIDMEALKMICGQALTLATIIALACSVGAALTSGSNARPPYRAMEQDNPRANSINSEHKYTTSSMWNSCGVIPYEGYEGWTNQGGSALECSDGAIVYDVIDEFTSAHAAEEERMARLVEKGPKHKPWRIAQAESLGDATVVEFAEPVSAGTKEGASNRWAVMWTRDKALLSIYGPDREHVINFYQTRHVGDAKK